MSRLIDADALAKDLSKLWNEMDDVDYGEYVRDANKLMNHYPTVDAVPVVRCCDCKWKKKSPKSVYCNALNMYVIDSDFFCGFGEKVSE